MSDMIQVSLTTVAVMCVLVGFLGGLLTGLVYHLFNQEIVVTTDGDDDDGGGDIPVIPDEPVHKPSRKPRFPVETN